MRACIVMNVLGELSVPCQFWVKHKCLYPAAFLQEAATPRSFAVLETSCWQRSYGGPKNPLSFEKPAQAALVAPFLVSCLSGRVQLLGAMPLRKLGPFRIVGRVSQRLAMEHG